MKPIKKELISSMDAIHFSRETKQAMVHSLVTQMEEQTMRKTRYSRKRLILISAAAVLLVAMLTGAAVFTRWSNTAQERYNPSQDVKEQAANSGLSVMLEQTNSNETLSVTDKNITVTAVQTIADSFGAELIFRIDGFSIPEGRFPWAWTKVTIDGNEDFYAYMGRSYNVDPSNNSFECNIHITFDETDGRYLGKEIAVEFSGFGLDSTQQAGEAEQLVEGCWELNWSLGGAMQHLTISPNTEIADTNTILMDAEIGQLSLRTVYQLESNYSGWKTMEVFQPYLEGIRTKDGTIHTCYPRTEGYMDEENLLYFVEHTMDSILDLSQLDSLVFRTEAGETVFIPIS